MPCEKLVGQDSQAVDVGPVGEGLPVHLFRADVRRVAQDFPGLGELGFLVVSRLQNPGDPEVAEGVAPALIGPEDVVGPHVPVDDPQLVGGGQGRSDLPKDPPHLRRGSSRPSAFSRWARVVPFTKGDTRKGVPSERLPTR